MKTRGNVYMQDSKWHRTVVLLFFVFYC